MNGLTGVLTTIPAAGEKTRTRARVDHRTSEEAVLVRRVQAKDEMAFKEIVERYQTKVFSIIYGILRNHNDAEDIAHERHLSRTAESSRRTHIRSQHPEDRGDDAHVTIQAAQCWSERTEGESGQNERDTKTERVDKEEQAGP